MFLKGEFEGETIDNTTEKEISAWLEVVRDLKPREVMIYTIDRETPQKSSKSSYSSPKRNCS